LESLMTVALIAGIAVIAVIALVVALSFGYWSR